MKQIQPPLQLDPESLQQLTSDQLIGIIVQQQALIEQLQQEIERLKQQKQSNSQTSSKPPSTDIIQKSEKPKTKNEDAEQGKRKPGGQPGHVGKTCKGFGRVDRYQFLRPSMCPDCGEAQFLELPVAVQRFSGGKTGREPVGANVTLSQQHLLLLMGELQQNQRGRYNFRYFCSSFFSFSGSTTADLSHERQVAEPISLLAINDLRNVDPKRCSKC